MKNLTLGQHLKWYLDDSMFEARTSDLQKFRFELGKVGRPLRAWSQELRLAMSQLIDEHGTKLALFYSGGSDSEVILRTLLDLGVKPDIYTIKFSKNENEHETMYADQMCQAHGLKQTVFVHDMTKFLEGTAQQLAEVFQCSQLAYLTVLEYVRKVDYPVIMGGEVYLQKHQRSSDTLTSPEEWYYIYREDEDGMTYRYSKLTGHTLINEALTYTPGLLLSWLQHPVIKAVANNEVPGKITLLSMKRGVYESELCTDLLAKTKFHGYEGLSWTNKAFTASVKHYWPKQQTARLEYNQLVESLR
jgi:hypothetical protein